MENNYIDIYWIGKSAPQKGTQEVCSKPKRKASGTWNHRIRRKYFKKEVVDFIKSCKNKIRFTQFSVAAITNDYKLGELKQQIFVFLIFEYQKTDEGLTELKSKNQPSCIPFWSLQGRTFLFVLSSFQKVPTFLGLWSLSYISKASNIASP